MRMIGIAAGLLALAGCTSPEEQARQRAAYLEALALTCDAYGFQRGTGEHAQCVQIEALRADLAAAERSARIQALSRDMQTLGRQIAPPPPAYRPPTTTTCRQNVYGVTCQTW